MMMGTQSSIVVRECNRLKRRPICFCLFIHSDDFSVCFFEIDKDWLYVFANECVFARAFNEWSAFNYNHIYLTSQ